MRILRAVTDDYIGTAEPVGSRTLAKKYHLGVSPATIRNEMADLEEGGYLRQPHTSAGRIPSDKGYRFYVDVLIDPQVVSVDQREVMRREILTKQHALEEMIRQTSRLLAWLTNEISIVVAPSLSNGTFRHIQFVEIEPTSVLIVLVVDPGFVQNRLVQLGGPVSAEQMQRLTDFCNKRLKGISLSDIGHSLVSDLKEVIDDGPLFEATLELLHRGLSKVGGDRVFVDGSVNLLNQPEFKDVERARVLLEVLENTDVLMDILNQAAASSGVHVRIGTENNREEINDCSIVTASYGIGGETIGTIGILGPTRMDYAKVISLVECMADALSELLSDWVGRSRKVI